MSVICIHQPDFAPWAGFFERLLHCDCFVLLDDVQFLRRGWHHRDRIKTEDGSSAWLTVPIKKAPRDTLIKDIEIASEPTWPERHLALLRRAYQGARYYTPVMREIEQIYTAGHSMLVDLNMALIRFGLRMFDIDVRLVNSSVLGVSSAGTQRLIDLTLSQGGRRYLTGTGSVDYLDMDGMREAGIEPVIHRYAQQPYPQLFGGFIGQLSCLDMFFNCGSDAAKLLRGPASPPFSPEPSRPSCDPVQHSRI